MPLIIPRTEWGARSPTGTIGMTTWGHRTGVAIHHSAGPTDQTVRSIQDYQMGTRGWPDIGYNWLVDQAGRLYEGRQGTWLAIGAHSAGENVSHVGVCWLGHSGNVAPTPAALATLRWVYDDACRRAGRVLTYSGHGQLPGEATECPGSRLRAWVASGMPTNTGGTTTMTDQWAVPLYEAAPETIITGEKVPAGSNTVTAAGMLSYALRNSYIGRRVAEALYRDKQALLVDAAKRGTAAALAEAPPIDPVALAQALAANSTAIDAIATAVAARVGMIPTAQQIAKGVGELTWRGVPS